MTKAKADPDETSTAGDRPRTGPVRVERQDDARDDEDAASAAPVEKPRASRSAPPTEVPSRVVRISGTASASVKALQVMLADLGFFKSNVTGFYGTETRNAVSDLQVVLRDHGYYLGRPHGTFDEPTRQALHHDPTFNTN
jgi:peptidoglycan hydrolase-like protein with peptidoglycan-binding domain